MKKGRNSRKKVKKSEAFQKQNVVILVLLLIMFAITLATYYGLGISEKTKQPALRTVTFDEDSIVQVEVAETLSQLQKGLMHRESLDENSGMLFVFAQEKPLHFWMKNTLIPLDMIFINNEYTIVSIQENAQPCTQEPCDVYPSNEPARYVVEVNAGYVDLHDIRVGQTVLFE